MATAVLVERLSARHRVELIDLAGFGVAMTAAERRAYESDEPIVDAGVRSSAEAVTRAEVVAFVTPLQSSGLSAPVKGGSIGYSSQGLDSSSVTTGACDPVSVTSGNSSRRASMTAVGSVDSVRATARAEWSRERSDSCAVGRLDPRGSAFGRRPRRLRSVTQWQERPADGDARLLPSPRGLPHLRCSR